MAKRKRNPELPLAQFSDKALIERYLKLARHAVNNKLSSYSTIRMIGKELRRRGYNEREIFMSVGD